MTKNFNTLLTLAEIKKCYKTGNFPNAYCLLLSKEKYVELLKAENSKVVITENKKGVQING